MIHRYWAGVARPSHQFTSSVLRRVHPEFDIRDWTDGDLPKPLMKILEASTHKVRPEFAMRHRANVVRLWVLREYGGWWVDHDFLALTPFDELPFPATAQHADGTRCNCWLAFPPNHWLLEQALDHICEFEPHQPRSSMEMSGEGLLTKLADSTISAIRLPLEVDGTRVLGTSLWGIHFFDGSSPSSTLAAL